MVNYAAFALIKMNEAKEEA